MLPNMGPQNYHYQTQHPQTPHPWTPEIIMSSRFLSIIIIIISSSSSSRRSSSTISFSILSLLLVSIITIVFQCTP